MTMERTVAASVSPAVTDRASQIRRLGLSQSASRPNRLMMEADTAVNTQAKKTSTGSAFSRCAGRKG
jgi:hypothetical protein